MILSSRPARTLVVLSLAAACARAPAPAPPAVPVPERAPAEAAPQPDADSLARAERSARAEALRASEVARRASVAADTVRVCAGGDVTLGTNLDTTWAKDAARKLGVRVRPFPDPDALLAPLRPAVRDADVVLLNIEGAIGEGAATRKCRKGSTNCYAFRQPPRTAPALRRLAADAQVVGNVAKKPARAAGDDGLLATVRHLSAAGIHVTGADTLPTAVVTAQSDTIAFLGFSTSGGPDPRDEDAVRRHVARAAARYPRVVVTMHMGAEGAAAQRTRDATELFLGIDRGNVVRFARLAASAGADLIVGHGPHVMRGGEWSGESLVLYSLGNLLTYGPFTLRDPNDRGGLLCATMDGEGRVRRAALRATHQVPPGIVRLDPSYRAAALLDSLARLDFPATAVRVDADGTITVPPPAADTILAPAPRR